MMTNETPKDTEQQEFDAIAGGRGPWANAWHPSWGENRDRPETRAVSEENAQDFSSDPKDSRLTDSPSSQS